MFSLACITGATSGIGEALAHLLASKKIPLLLSGRNEKKLEELTTLLSSQVPVKTIVADLAQKKELEKLKEAIFSLSPTLLINNAGLGTYGPFWKHRQEKVDELLIVNNQALVDLTLAAIQALKAKKERGVILNVSSAAAFQVFPYFSLYAASKAFVNHFSLSLDEEVKDIGIRVLTSCPGVVETNFRARAGGKKTPMTNMTAEFAAQEIWKQIEKKTPLRIFDFRYRLLTRLSYFIPNSLKAHLLKKSLSRVSKS